MRTQHSKNKGNIFINGPKGSISPERSHHSQPHPPQSPRPRCLRPYIPAQSRQPTHFLPFALCCPRPYLFTLRHSRIQRRRCLARPGRRIGRIPRTLHPQRDLQEVSRRQQRSALPFRRRPALLHQRRGAESVFPHGWLSGYLANPHPSIQPHAKN